ncbi:MAG: WYL domain-containing protein [Betaproteobacteria bacterium]|nr:WYL domain-containing protein [Betaproteobacteria bacterium]
MDRTERFYKIDQLLTERGLLPFDALLAALEVSPATLKRDLQYLRDRLNAPIVWDRERGGYRYESAPSGAGHAFELPGLWFSPAEIHALLTMRQLLAGLDSGGLLGPHVQPLMVRLENLLGAGSDAAEQVRARVKVLGLGARPVQAAQFQRLGSALLRRRRLRIAYRSRGQGELTQREISPQRLVHYRGNWYLDAWCHLRRAIRSFSVDAIEQAAVLRAGADEIAETALDEILGEGYGIFSGPAHRWAALRFTPERARWVAQEQWHPSQRGRFSPDGSYLLEIPYADDRELVMDILKHGPEVEVIAPAALRNRVSALLADAGARYAQPAAALPVVDRSADSPVEG